MTTREEYQTACRNYRMSQVNRAHLATDRFDYRWNEKSAFVSVSAVMREIAAKHTISGSIFSDKKYYDKNGMYNNRLNYLLKQATKK